MGYMRHHMIVVTSYDERLIISAHSRATDLFTQDDWRGRTVAGVTPIMTSPVNGYYTFFVAPDGSKEGWEDSDRGDRSREELVNWLEAQRFEDRSSPLKWAGVQYGDDNHDNRVLRHDGEVEIVGYYYDKDC